MFNLISFFINLAKWIQHFIKIKIFPIIDIMIFYDFQWNKRFCEVFFLFKVELTIKLIKLWNTRSFISKNLWYRTRILSSPCSNTLGQTYTSTFKQRLVHTQFVWENSETSSLWHWHVCLGIWQGDSTFRMRLFWLIRVCVCKKTTTKGTKKSKYKLYYHYKN